MNREGFLLRAEGTDGNVIFLFFVGLFTKVCLKYKKQHKKRRSNDRRF